MLNGESVSHVPKFGLMSFKVIRLRKRFLASWTFFRFFFLTFLLQCLTRSRGCVWEGLELGRHSSDSGKLPLPLALSNPRLRHVLVPCIVYKRAHKILRRDSTARRMDDVLRPWFDEVEEHRVIQITQKINGTFCFIQGPYEKTILMANATSKRTTISEHQ